MSEEAAVIAEVAPSVPAVNAPPTDNPIHDLLPELPAYLETSLFRLQDDDMKHHRAHNLTAEEKATFIRHFAAGGNIASACERIKVAIPTIYERLKQDVDFARALSLAKLSMGQNLQEKSYHVAMTDKGTFDRGLQLRRFFPSVYRNSDPSQTLAVQVNVGYRRRS